MSREGKHSLITFTSLPSSLAALTTRIFKNSLPVSLLLNLCQLDDIEEKELHDLLHQEERDQLAHYRFPKRHREYLGGRLCAKESLFLFRKRMDPPLPPLPSDGCRVSRGESGRPFFQLEGVQVNNDPTPQVSISHSQNYGAALVSYSPCGIDIQYIDDGLERVKERFCSSAEEQILRRHLTGQSTLTQLSLLWTGKEALKKMLSPDGMPGFHDLKLHSLQVEENGNLQFQFTRTEKASSLLTVVAGLLNSNYTIGLCCKE